MPVREVLVTDIVESHRVHGIVNVQQDPVPRAGPSGQADFGVNRDVVALVGLGGFLGARAMIAARPETRYRTSFGISKNTRAIDDRRRLRPGERNLDHIDTE